MQGKFTIGFGPILLIGFVILSSSLSRANSADEGGNASSGVTPQELRYTFSWNFDTESDLRPRGGTTTAQPGYIAHPTRKPSNTFVWPHEGS